MTNEEINEEVAKKLGYEFDQEIEMPWGEKRRLWKSPLDHFSHEVPNFCTSITAAWEIFGGIKTLGSIYRTPEGYICSFATVPERTEMQARTASRAICLAFLKLESRDMKE